MRDINKLCILVCEYLKKEAAAVIREEGFDNVIAATFPARCGRPPVKWEDLDQVVRGRADCKRIHVLGGCCITGLSSGQGQNITVTKPGQCFYMLCGREIIDGYLGQGAYLLTPGWARCWRHRVEEWGIKQSGENGLGFFNESIKRLVLLDSGIDADSTRHLRKFAEFVHRPFEVLPVGLDFFRLFLAKIVQGWLLETNQPAKAPDEAQKQVADYAMSLELLSSMTRVMTEPEAEASILDLFTMLFAPGKLRYVPAASDAGSGSTTSGRPADFQGDYAWTESGKGFLLRIAYGKETLGILEVDQIAFPEYKEHYLNLSLSIARVCGLVIKNAATYRQMKRAQEAIKASLAEKEVLLKEIHHRVKNNLQTISSLLFLQSKYVENKQALEAFKNTRERLMTMALIHEKLYRSEDLSKINYREYIRSLIVSLFESYALNPGQVRLETQVENIFMDINTAIPLGLIINELVSNSLKHAFPGGRKGELRVNLGKNEDKEYPYRLVIEDNGIGFPENPGILAGDSLGMKLIGALVKQIHAFIQVDGNNGATFTIKFKELNYKKA